MNLQLLVILINCFFLSSKGRRESFEHVKSWYDRAKQLGGQDIEPILIGNKNDINSSLIQVFYLYFSLIFYLFLDFVLIIYW